jgi:hypothetical protein
LRDDGKMKERGIHEEFFSRDKEREVKVENWKLHAFSFLPHFQCSSLIGPICLMQRFMLTCPLLCVTNICHIYWHRFVQIVNDVNKFQSMVKTIKELLKDANYKAITLVGRLV